MSASEISADLIFQSFHRPPAWRDWKKKINCPFRVTIPLFCGRERQLMVEQTQPTLFATTRWTIIRDAVRGGDTLAVEALGSLVGTYWQPLYRFARRKGKTSEDAEDLVQGFLAHVIEDRALGTTDPSKGRFRAFLLASFQHWMINDVRGAAGTGRTRKGAGS